VRYVCVNWQVLGLILIAGGSVLQAVYKDYFAFFGNDVNSTAIFVIIIGIICTILSFFGCCGAIKENHFMLITVIFIYRNII